MATLTLDSPATTAFTVPDRIESLRITKLKMTQEKQKVVGAMNHDDWGLILPPEEYREVVQTISTSGMPITDVLLKGVKMVSNHPDGGFYGAKACGANLRALLEAMPPYVDPMSSLAGGYYVNFSSYRKGRWHPDLDYSWLHEEQKKYKLGTGIGAGQHFCQDLTLGFALGWGGMQAKIDHYRALNAGKGQEVAEFYEGIEDVVKGIQAWIQHNADAARAMAATEQDPALKQNLLEMADMNDRLVTEPPQTFREACQWMLWYNVVARLYNGSGSLGKLDVVLQPYYDRDIAAGILTDEEATLHIASYLVRDTGYLQLGGPDETGKDATTQLSFLVLEAAHLLRIPANVGVSVGKDVDPRLLRRSVEILFEDKAGMPKFLGVDRTIEGYMKNGYSIEDSRQRAYSGCHWSAIPGREYTLNDCVKINFGAVFEVALKEMMADSSVTPSTPELWSRFESHLRRAVQVIGEGLDFHLANMYKVMPELALDLLCTGPIEKGMDATQYGAVEFYNLCVDGAALATVADSFAALEQRVDKEQKLTWPQMMGYLESNWGGADGERMRLMMKGIPRYGTGGSRADDWAVRVSQTFTRLVKENPTPKGVNLMPGIFSWANTIPMGKELGATPNGRRVGDPISHGSNPDPGFRKDGASTAMATAIAAVQCGYGNTAPMQIEFDPALARDEGGVDKVADLIRTHFEMGGTQINMNIMDAEQVLEAHKDPSKYPDLVVRVTGFSAYFASLSPDFRQLVVDRIINERA
jgi:formate C-acetyltransferase